MNIEEKARDAVAYLQLPGGDSLAYNYLRGLLSTFRDEVLEEVAHLAFRTESDTFAEFAVELRKLKSQPTP